MPRQPSTLFELHTQQQPFTLVHEHEAWHVTFPGHRCELDVKGSRIEAQAIARCYFSLFLMPGAPFAHADMSECEMLDLAEREAGARYGHSADRGDGRDARGRFVDGGQAARDCGHLGFEAAIESIISRYPDATYTRNPGDEVHISRSFFYWLQQQGRA